jgi:hypothetical protein
VFAGILRFIEKIAVGCFEMTSAPHSSKMVGHTSLKSTQIYARIVDSKISEVMEKVKSKLEMDSSK